MHSEPRSSPPPIPPETATWSDAPPPAPGTASDAAGAAGEPACGESADAGDKGPGTAFEERLEGAVHVLPSWGNVRSPLLRMKARERLLSLRRDVEYTVHGPHTHDIETMRRLRVALHELSHSQNLLRAEPHASRVPDELALRTVRRLERVTSALEGLSREARSALATEIGHRPHHDDEQNIAQLARSAANTAPENLRAALAAGLPGVEASLDALRTFADDPRVKHHLERRAGPERALAAMRGCARKASASIRSSCANALGAIAGPDRYSTDWAATMALLSIGASLAGPAMRLALVAPGAGAWHLVLRPLAREATERLREQRRPAQRETEARQRAAERQEEEHIRAARSAHALHNALRGAPRRVIDNIEAAAPGTKWNWPKAAGEPDPIQRAARMAARKSTGAGPGQASEDTSDHADQLARGEFPEDLHALAHTVLQPAQWREHSADPLTCIALAAAEIKRANAVETARHALHAAGEYAERTLQAIPAGAGTNPLSEGQAQNRAALARLRAIARFATLEQRTARPAGRGIRHDEARIAEAFASLPRAARERLAAQGVTPEHRSRDTTEPPRKAPGRDTQFIPDPGEAAQARWLAWVGTGLHRLAEQSARQVVHHSGPHRAPER